MFTLYHNSHCSKSNCALDYLEKENIPYQLVDILKNPLTRADLKILKDKLTNARTEMIRKSDYLFQEEFASLELSEEEMLVILEANPELLQRPIIEFEETAVIGRSFDTFKEFVERNR